MRIDLRVLLALISLLPPCGHAASAQDQAKIEAGAALYEEHCATCHGERLVSTGSAFDLRKLAPEDRPRFDKALEEGKGQMPSWAGQLSPEEIDAIWAYIRSRVDR
jgi:mono/diheme cytochrome c family protein